MMRGCHEFQRENKGVQRSGAASECYMSKHRCNISTAAQNTADSGFGGEGCTERGALPGSEGLGRPSTFYLGIEEETEKG